MSKDKPTSKYLPSFYGSGASGSKSNSAAGSSQKSLPHEADKFRKPADFFKSSQSNSTQRISAPAMKRTSFGGGGSTHEMLSQSFQPKKAIAPQSKFSALRKAHVDASAASTKALELQWTTKMRAKSTADKRNFDVKSPMGKTWANSSLKSESCKNQENDPWYSNDVWGDDLSAEAVDECLRFATQQQKTAESTSIGGGSLSSWMDEPWTSPAKTARTALFVDKKKDDFKHLLAGDDEFLALVDDVESSLTRPAPIPLVDRLPVGSRNYVVKAKEFESPSKTDLAQSQRTFRKPTKSLPSPTTSKLSFTTEWLRGQLEKISSEYSTVKEDLQVKEGESKLLREKLKCAEEEVQKHKLEKVRELENLRETFERKVKALEKQLEATQVQVIFKSKEAESSMEKYRELKSVSVVAPESPVVSGFKALVPGSRPGEAEMDVIDATMIEETFAVPLPSNHNKRQTPTAWESNDVVEATVIDETFSDSSKIIEAVEPKKGKDNSEVIVASIGDAKWLEETFAESGKVEKVNAEAQATGVIEVKSLIFDFRIKNQFTRVVERLVHGPQPKKELNHFLMPPIDYLPHTLLHTEFSEQQVENYAVRRPTIAELWGARYDAFGDVELDDYERAAVGDPLPLDPARAVLSKSRHFSTMAPIHGELLTLSNKTHWTPEDRRAAKNVVDLATRMCRELYATLGDPRYLRTTYTIYDREPTILREFAATDELANNFELLNHESYKHETFVELRRCLVVVGWLCTFDRSTARYIFNPKSTKTDLNRSNSHNESTLKIVLNEGERKPSEIKMMQMYRDLHAKKLTSVSEFDPKIPEKMDVPNTDVVRSEICRHSQLAANVLRYERVDVYFEKFGLDYGFKQLVEKMPEVCKTISLKTLVNIPNNLMHAIESGLSSGDVMTAPYDQCLTVLERQMCEMTLKNIKELRSRAQFAGSSAPLDVTRYVVEGETSRKRKNDDEGEGTSKIMRVVDYGSPLEDLCASKFESAVEVGVGFVTTMEDEQMSKFEKREEMAELKKKMLAEEKPKRLLAPIKLRRTSPSREDSADKEFVVEIEKMFQTQRLPEEVADSDDDVDYPTNDVEIEFIPDLIKHFHRKMENAGLLELLSEIFKEGGVLRFTHRLNGVMLGAVVMLQQIVARWPCEVDPYAGKLAAIVREILYCRPSPRVVAEINGLLCVATKSPSFVKMLCHNAAAETFVINVDKVYFKRGACLLEVICILVTYSSTNCDAEHDDMVRWIYRVIDNKHVTSLYERSDTRRCMCITALNNTVVMLFHRAVASYRRHVETCSNFTARLRLDKTISLAVQILRTIYIHGPLSFLYSIKTQYSEYRQSLLWLTEMHRNSILYSEFTLSSIDLFVVNQLLKDDRHPQPSPQTPQWTVRPNLNADKTSGFDDLVKSDSEESEEE